MCDLGWFELTVNRGQFGRLCRQVYRKESKQAGAELGQAQLKLDLEMVLTSCYIKFILKNIASNFYYHHPLPTTEHG